MMKDSTTQVYLEGQVIDIHNNVSFSFLYELKKIYIADLRILFNSVHFFWSYLNKSFLIIGESQEERTNVTY